MGQPRWTGRVLGTEIIYYGTNFMLCKAKRCLCSFNIANPLYKHEEKKRKKNFQPKLLQGVTLELTAAHRAPVYIAQAQPSSEQARKTLDLAMGISVALLSTGSHQTQRRFLLLVQTLSGRFLLSVLGIDLQR
jgi:hypothetical protein